MGGLTYGSYGATAALTVIGLCKRRAHMKEPGNGRLMAKQICCSMAKAKHSTYVHQYGLPPRRNQISNM